MATEAQRFAASASKVGKYVSNPASLTNPAVRSLIAGFTSTAPTRMSSLMTNANSAIKSADAAMANDNSAYLRQLQSQIDALDRQTYAPKIDYAAINARARKAAGKAVNPLYTKRLNQFLKGQAQKAAAKKKEYELNVKDIEDTLAESLGTSAIKRTRTGEDVTANVGEINTAEDQFQTDSGQQFDQERTALTGDVAEAGLTTSGLGQQQQQLQQEQRNVGEQRQGEEFQKKRQEQELFKTRTFEDLMRSDELAGKSAEKGKVREKFDLDSYIKQSDLETEKEKFSMETERANAVAQEQERQRAALTRAWVNSIKDPAQRDAAARAYL